MGSSDAEAPIRILLADDHSVIRSGLRMLLGEESDFEVVGEAEDAAGAKRMVEKRRPDVLVLDLQMPGANPVEDVPRLIESNPGTRVVVLTMRNDPLTAREVLRAGAAGYVLKQAADSQLVEAIRVAASGGSYVNPQLGAALATVDRDPVAQLSDRDRELLRLAALGHTNREIGERLYLSVRAIEVNRSQLQGRLGINSRPELVRFAVENKLIEPSDERPG
jgi:two-component system, NarL family, response regulator NreC